MKLLKTLAALAVLATLTACSGVTPSIKASVTHHLPFDSATTDNKEIAWGWSLGGSVKASFPESGAVIESCGVVGFTWAVNDGDISSNRVPAEFCVEVDTANLDLAPARIAEIADKAGVVTRVRSSWPATTPSALPAKQ